jgi:hypothetical protein
LYEESAFCGSLWLKSYLERTARFGSAVRSGAQVLLLDGDAERFVVDTGADHDARGVLERTAI